jgi:hypothetical protein
MTAYNNTVPAKQRDEMPSLREWYELLSVALHAALHDERLFEATKPPLNSILLFGAFFVFLSAHQESELAARSLV